VFAENQLPGNFYSSTSSVDASASARVWGVSNTTTYRLSDALLLKNIVGYRSVRYSQVTDADGSPFQLVDSFIPGDGRQFSEELQLQYDQDNIHVIGGLFYFTERGHDYNDKGRLGQSVVLAGLAGYTTYNHFLKNNSKSGFIEATIDVTAKLHLTAGGRYTWDKRYRDARNFSGLVFTNQHCRIRDDAGVPLPDNACFTEATAKFKKPTFNLTAKYDLADRQQVYASWRRGYRTGGFSLDPLLVTAGNVPYQPETVDAFEGGYKGEFSLGGDAAFRLNVAGYYSTYDNIQKNQNLTVTFPGPPATTVLQTITVNAAKARIWGVEVEPTLSINRNLQINGSYSYTNAKYKKFIGFGNNNTPIDLSDTPWGYQPKHKLTGAVQWTIPAGDGGLTLSPSAVYQSAQEVEEVPGPGTHQPGYTLVNFRGEYDFGNGLNLGLWVNNLTKKHYYVAANNVYDALGYTVAYPGEPRMYGADLSFKF
jgi:iron complex outermembrane receptor protein